MRGPTSRACFEPRSDGEARCRAFPLRTNQAPQRDNQAPRSPRCITERTSRKVKGLTLAPKRLVYRRLERARIVSQMSKSPRSAQKPETRLVHAGRDPDEHFGFVNPPGYPASTVLYPTAADQGAP